MILFKKSYAEQLLHLALALSLLRVNPDSYLGYGWQSQLATNNGDGIQLELQHAVPALYDYPYSNRKAIPIIEDLVHFNRYRQTNSYDIQTYLLNIQNEQNSETAAQEQPTNNETISNLENRTSESLLTAATYNELDLFLNSAHYIDSDTLHDLNIADLRDYDDRPIPSAAAANSYSTGQQVKDELLDIYTDINGWVKEETASTSNVPQEQRIEYAGAGLPIKYEPPDTDLASGIIKEEMASTSFSTSDLGGSVNTTSQSSNYTKVIDWSEFYDITPVTVKKEEEDDVSSSDGSPVKREPEHENNSTTSGFSSSVELTQEVIFFSNVVRI